MTVLRLPLNDASTGALEAAYRVASHAATRYEQVDVGCAAIFRAFALGCDSELRRRFVGRGTPTFSIAVADQDDDPAQVDMALDLACAAAARLRKQENLDSAVGDLWSALAAECQSVRDRRRWAVVNLERQLGPQSVRD